MTAAVAIEQIPAADTAGLLSVNVNTRVEVLSFCVTVRRAGLETGLTPRQVGELSLVVAELGTNAALHGKGGTINVMVSPTAWRVVVSDRGPGFTQAVLEDAGQSDRLGPDGVRPPGDGRRSFGSGLASVRRLSTSLHLHNDGLGACVTAAKTFLQPKPLTHGALS